MALQYRVFCATVDAAQVCCAYLESSRCGSQCCQVQVGHVLSFSGWGSPARGESPGQWQSFLCQCYSVRHSKNKQTKTTANQENGQSEMNWEWTRGQSTSQCPWEWEWVPPLWKWKLRSASRMVLSHHKVVRVDLLKALWKHQICFLPLGFSLTKFLLISSLFILRDYTLILIKL